MYEINIFLLLVGYNNKGEYISIDQVIKDEVEVCINDQAVPDKTSQLVRRSFFI